MTSKPLIAAGGAITVAAVLAWGSWFIVDERQMALVLQFGQPVRTVSQPGLSFKLPFIQDVAYYDKRLLDVDPEPSDAITADNKRIIVDAYARYRITDPLTMRRATGNQAGDAALVVVRDRMERAIRSSMRNVVASTSLDRLLSPERANVMQQIQRDVAEPAKALGVQIVDVRIGRLSLSQEVSQSVFTRMRSEREREAAEFRAQGQETAQQIRSRADRERTVLLAEAQREAQIARGSGDAEAVRIYADAFGKDPGFFAFYRSMQAYREVLSQGTTMVLSPESDFFRFFNDRGGLGRPVAPAPTVPAAAASASGLPTSVPAATPAVPTAAPAPAPGG